MNRSRMRVQVFGCVVACGLMAGWDADAQKMYAMKMNSWAGTRGSLKEVPKARSAALAEWATLQELPAANHHAVTTNGNPSRGTNAFRAKPSVLASGLDSPDGVACHPSTGVIYVSEEDAARISMVGAESRIVAVDRSTPIIETVKGRDKTVAPLRSPEGIAFSGDGALYAVEDYPGGRLIRFTLGENGKAVRGNVVRIPGNFRDYAWESVACRDGGEILLAGSTLEKVASDDFVDAFLGALLYRDGNGDWWLVLRSAFESFSAVAFSGDGRAAVYACEVTGDIGWVDLRRHELRQGHSGWFAKSPEGIDVLPDGRLLIAEEAGSIVLLDPSSDSREVLFRGHETLESVLYDRAHQRVLITADGGHELLSMPLERPAVTTGRSALDSVKYETAHTPTHVPETMSAFLTNTLSQCGLFPTEFRRFAEHIPMIALSAAAVPADPAVKEADPIRLVQFLVLHPAAVTVINAGLDMPVSAFAVVRASGKVQRTVFTNMNSAVVASLGLDHRGLDSVRVGLPYPFAADVSPEGRCNIHFSGLAQTPDYHFVLDPEHVNGSYMVVDRNDGKLWQYKLLPPNGETKAENMVISYRQHSERDWVPLLEEGAARGKAVASLTSEPTSRTKTDGG